MQWLLNGANPKLTIDTLDGWYIILSCNIQFQLFEYCKFVTIQSIELKKYTMQSTKLKNIPYSQLNSKTSLYGTKTHCSIVD